MNSVVAAKVAKWREQAARARAAGDVETAQRFEQAAADAEARERAIETGQTPWQAAANGQAVTEAHAVAPARARRAKTLSMSEVETRRVEWLWPGRVPLGKLTLIAGDGGCGKSTLTADMAARVSTGAPWHDGAATLNEPGGVLMLSAEDDPGDTIKPRLLAHGADCSRVHLLRSVIEVGGERMANLADVAAIDEAIGGTPDCRLVVIDPVSAYVEAGRDDHKNSEVRGMLAPLSELAERKRVAIVCVHHLNKAMAGTKALYRVVGSIAWAAAARAAWGVAIDEKDEAPNEADRRRLLVPLKMNCGKPARSWAYHVVEDFGHDTGRVEWEPEAAEGVDANSAFGGATRSKPSPALDEAAAFLRDVLARERLTAEELFKRAKAEGISVGTLRRAKERVGAVATKTGQFGGPSYWTIPGASLWAGANDAHVP